MVAQTREMKPERWSPARAALVVFVVTAALCGVRLGSPGLTEPDEGRFAAVAHSMWLDKDFVTPRINGFVYLDKPPLLHWVTALSIGLLGPNEFAVRLSSLLAGAAGVALTYAFGRRVAGHHAGLASAAVLGTGVMWFAVSRVIRYDMLLALSITATIWCAWLGSEAGREGRRYWCYAATSTALGILVKGPVALALPLLTLLVYLAAVRRLRVLLEVPWPACIAIVVLIAGPWFMLCERANPGATRFFFLRENLARVTGGIARTHVEPWWFFLPIMLGACFPWTLFLPGALADGCGEWRHGSDEQQRACVLWVLWAGLTIAVFSLPQVKVWTYILPAMPAVALLIGRHVSSGRGWGMLLTSAVFVAGSVVWLTVGGREAAERQVPTSPLLPALATVWLICGLGALTQAALRTPKLALVALAVGALGTYHLGVRVAELMPDFPSDKTVAAKVADLRRPGERIFCVRELSRGSLFYLDARAAVFGKVPDEYDFPPNVARLGGWVYPMDEARGVLATGPSAIILCRRGHWDEFRAAAGDVVEPINDSGKYLILRSKPTKAAGPAEGDGG